MDRNDKEENIRRSMTEYLRYRISARLCTTETKEPVPVRKSVAESRVEVSKTPRQIQVPQHSRQHAGIPFHGKKLVSSLPLLFLSKRRQFCDVQRKIESLAKPRP